MVGTIVPMVHGKSVAIRCWGRILYILSSAVGGSVVGALLGFLGRSVASLLLGESQNYLAILGWACVLCSFHEANLIKIPFPQWRSQVPQRWRGFGFASLALYGFVLGVGIGTRINTATHYAIILGVALDGNFRTSVLAMAAFGVARALPACLLSAFSFGGATALLGPVIRAGEIMHLMNAVVLIYCGLRLLIPCI